MMFAGATSGPSTAMQRGRSAELDGPLSRLLRAYGRSATRMRIARRAAQCGRAVFFKASIAG
ncbi:hypothetical protein WS73_28200 [Burkholderia savannae]|nr:hypothetical protein WS73_28200 [Burkholderia savannae]